MPPKGWKKSLAGKPKTQPDPVSVIPAVADPIEVTPREQTNTGRFLELMRCLPEPAFIQMACASGLQTQQIRELCDLFRNLKS